MKVSSTHTIISVLAAALVCSFCVSARATSFQEALYGLETVLVETSGKSQRPRLFNLVVQGVSNDWVNVSTPSATPRSRFAEMKELIEVVASGLTLLAIVVGGTWSYLLFIRTRQKYPSANINQEITYRRITPDRIWIRVTVTLQNTGKVLLSLVSGLTWVQQVLPLDTEIREKIDKLEDPVLKHESQIRWPLAEPAKELLWKKGEHEIEPSETDQVYFDFIVDSEIRTIVVYTYFSNVKKFRRSSLGWQIIKVYDLGPDEKSIVNKENNDAPSPTAGDAAEKTARVSASQTARETPTEATPETSEKEIRFD